jgi:hypothetical protein
MLFFFLRYILLIGGLKEGKTKKKKGIQDIK